MKRKNITYPLLLLIALISIQCTQMDDNYSSYLDDPAVYSPKVTNLNAISGLREVELMWDNPQGDVAKQIFIDYQDTTITIDSLVEYILITGLEIKGYDISVYTLDAFNNLSIPASISVFPNGEENN